MAIPAEHTVVKADTLSGVGAEMMVRIANLVHLTQVGDTFSFEDNMGTTTMKIEDNPEGGYILDVNTVPK